MNERERADSLARAIDDLIRGARTPEHFEDEDLRSLIQVAEARRKAAIESGERAAKHTSEIWRRLTARLDGEEPRHNEPHDDHNDDMRDVIATRRQATEDVRQLAERHRDDVWQRIQEKVANQRPKKRGFFSFLEARTSGDVPLRRAGWGHTGMMLTGDADTDSLLRVALSSPSYNNTARMSGSAQYQLRVRMRSDPGRLQQATRPVREPSRPRATFILRAGAAAAFAIGALVLAPIPFTGLNESPVAEAARFAADHIGVSETDMAPPSAGMSTTVEGIDTTAADAASRLGLPIVAPTEMMGLPVSSQTLFDGDASMFVATYAGEGASITLREEAAGGPNAAVPDGVAGDTMVNGLPATYYEGSWTQAPDGSLMWQTSGTRTLVFERGDVRFTITYAGAAITSADLSAAASAIP